ncbi:hypothetical protein [Dinghuibacter silviterrae]|uniref:Uncharacterized protein n=1 Tax=Dinghuibacter silviterrae TaxID=1539049 RepID=A0A4R8DEW6_9BACT|nr:hypothetical protein [Dinghuibacter silviterrae]TDW95774.1 hypothetical protein EDB95_3585 [Dinghuibacter silviterrae]
MNDPLKKYIKAHRDEFDSEVPGPAVWEHISQRMTMTSAVRPLRAFRWGMAAAVTVLALISLGLYFQDRGDHSRRVPPPIQTDTTTEASYDQEMGHFSQIITIKYKEIESIKATHPELYRRFTADLQKLDQSYQELKTQLPGQANQEVVLQAMLQNLALQVDLINRQLDIIEQLKSESHVQPVTHI